MGSCSWAISPRDGPLFKFDIEYLPDTWARFYQGHLGRIREHEREICKGDDGGALALFLSTKPSAAGEPLWEVVHVDQNRSSPGARLAVEQSSDGDAVAAKAASLPEHAKFVQGSREICRQSRRSCKHCHTADNQARLNRSTARMLELSRREPTTGNKAVFSSCRLVSNQPAA